MHQMTTDEIRAESIRLLELRNSSQTFNAMMRDREEDAEAATSQGGMERKFDEFTEE